MKGEREKNIEDREKEELSVICHFWRRPGGRASAGPAQGVCRGAVGLKGGGSVPLQQKLQLAKLELTRNSRWKEQKDWLMSGAER